MSTPEPPSNWGQVTQPASQGGARPGMKHSSYAWRWALVVGVAVMLGIAMVLVFMLTLATNNQARFERYFAQLLMVNVVVAALLLLTIIWSIWRLVSRLQRGKFGSRLLIKLAAIFALVGFLPGVLIYGVSYQFVTRSIESWFDVKVEGALDAGLNLGRTTLESLSSDLASKTRATATQLAELGDGIGPLTLERTREQLAASDVVLWSAAGQVLASAGDSRFTLQPERPSPQQFRTARSQRVISQIEGLDEIANSSGSEASARPVVRMRALALISAPGLGLTGEVRFLQVTQAVAPSVVANALAVQEAYKEYQERALARSGLRNMYIATLTLSLFLAVFGAVLLAAVLGNQLVQPLLVLADGVAQVAAGDLRPKAALMTRDELGGLTRSFADMTQQLSDARSQVQRSLGALDASRANLQTILDNLTAGVIVLDAQGHIITANPSATRVLRAPLAAYEGQLLALVPGLEDFARDVGDQFSQFASQADEHGAEQWQQALELQAASQSETAAMLAPDRGGVTSLLTRGALLPEGRRLLVFDDITEVVSAQRARAWGEVARRLAHEIKNPLTPIQLSAERLEMKLQDKLPAAENGILKRSVKTIVDQVDAMKRLVNEFRDYARLPAAELKPVELNTLVQELLQLYAPENAEVPVSSQLDPSCPMVKGDAQQLRQVIHNLLQNAQDATAARRALEPQRPLQPVQIKTQYMPDTQRVRLVVRDWGTGFQEPILKRAFEPYVTTKARGTGLGLAVVKKIADEHGARIDLVNRTASALEGGDKTVIGAQVSLSLPIA
jgi:nitrogen fixation/metabolism regulation signal transduction histidine kinase